MITALIVIGCIIGYLGTVAGIFGYLRGLRDEGDCYIDDLHFMGAIFFPITALIFAGLFVMRPFHWFGEWIRQRQSTKAKKRIEAQTKMRIELEKAERVLREAEQETERALEDQFRALDKQEGNRR